MVDLPVVDQARQIIRRHEAIQAKLQDHTGA